MASALLALIGGKVQGVEAAYLARKAGWRVLLVDRNPSCPARGLCDMFVCANVCAERKWIGATANADLVLPALEDDFALKAIRSPGDLLGIPVAFDFKSYEVSSSKQASNRLFQNLRLPAPRLWPDTEFPLIMKPDGSSGSKGIRIIREAGQLKRTLASATAVDRWVIQEHIPGNSHSIEVIGVPGAFHALQVTDLFVEVQIEENLNSDLGYYRVLFDATPVRQIIRERHIHSDTYICAPGMPLGVDARACQKLGKRMLHDPLLLGTRDRAVVEESQKTGTGMAESLRKGYRRKKNPEVQKESGSCSPDSANT